MNSNKSKISCKQGFTLIELLVVVLIIGILAAVAVPQYQKAVDKSRMTQAFVWAKTLSDAEQVYYLANGKYTKVLEELDINLPACSKGDEGDNYAEYSCDEGWQITLAPLVPGAYVLLPSKYVPKDTKAGIQYHFKNDLRLCYAESSRFEKVCRSMGATDYVGYHYKLP